MLPKSKLPSILYNPSEDDTFTGNLTTMKTTDIIWYAIDAVEICRVREDIRELSEIVTSKKEGLIDYIKSLIATNQPTLGKALETFIIF